MAAIFEGMITILNPNIREGYCCFEFKVFMGVVQFCLALIFTKFLK